MSKKPVTITALQLINRHTIESPSRFAELLWPESEAWERRYNTGRGAMQGYGLYKSAGSFLGKLRKKGLIDFRYKDVHGSRRDIWVTEKGKAMLREYAESGA